MPLTVSVGLSKKVGQPEFGSLGATCNVAFELEASLLQTDLRAFHDQVHNAYSACAQAVNDQLAKPQVSGSNGNQTEIKQPSTGNGGGGNGHRATDKQLGFARQLAGQIQGLGVRRLDVLANKMFAKPIAELSTLDASGLIDTIKAIKAGEVKLDDAINGAPV